MSVRTPAIVAGALFASLIGTASAHAATARILPLIDTGSSGYTTMNLALSSRDDCRFRTAMLVMPGDSAYPSYTTPVKTVNGCRPGFSTIWEDGSVSTTMTMHVPTANLPRGRAFVGVNVWTRARWTGAPWVRHGFIRSFWHTPAAQMPTAHIATTDVEVF